MPTFGSGTFGTGTFGGGHGPAPPKPHYPVSEAHRLRLTAITPTGRGYDLTDEAEMDGFSNVDPGGDETCSFTLKRPWLASNRDIRKGTVIEVSDGITPLWTGRLREDSFAGGDTEYVAVTAYGAGAALGDTNMRQIFIDRSASSWESTTLNMRIAVNDTLDVPIDREYSMDVKDASIRFDGTVDKQIRSGARTMVMYVAPDGVKIGGFGWRGIQRFAGNVEAARIYAGDDDRSTNLDEFHTTALNDTVGRVEFNEPRRFLMLRAQAASTHTPTTQAFSRTYKQVAVYGDHGLPLVTHDAGPPGLTADQIIAYTITMAKDVTMRRRTAGSFVILHFLADNSPSLEDVISAANEFEGMVWGTWSADSVLDMSRHGYFDLVGRDFVTQHWIASRSDFEDLDLASELESLYNRVEIEHTDETETKRLTVYEHPVPELDELGIVRTLSITAGEMTTAQALQLGQLALRLQGSWAPARGSGRISGRVRHHTRGSLPAWYLRAGTNFRIPEVLPAGDLVGIDDTPDRRTTFPIKRVRVDLAGDYPVVDVDFDQANDQLSVLQSQLGLGADFTPVETTARPARKRKVVKTGRFSGGGNRFEGY